MQTIPYGLCHCGCGQKTNIIKQSDNRHGRIKGEPYRYMWGHQHKVYGSPKKKLSNNKRNPKVDGQGYINIYQPDHPNTHNNGYIFEHILIAEKALGKYLPQGAVIHHVDGNRKNNSPNNLVICQDNVYHHSLHRRIRALKTCGHVNWRKCNYCHQYDSPENMYVYRDKQAAHHPECLNRYKRNFRLKKKLAKLTSQSQRLSQPLPQQ